MLRPRSTAAGLRIRAPSIRGGTDYYEVVAATAEGNTGTLTYKWTSAGNTYTCDGNTKISAIENVGFETRVIIVGPSGGVVDLCGVADDGAQRRLAIQGGTTVDTGQAKITINGASTLYVKNATTTIADGSYGDIKKSDFGTGTLTFAKEANLKVNDLEADELQVQSITANNLNVNTLRAIGGTGVTVNDTLTVGNVYLSADSITAGTIIATGDIISPQLVDRITVTTGDLTARNIEGIGITVEKGDVNASGNILVNEGVDVKGNLKAGNVTAQEGNITVEGNLVANNIDAQNKENKQDGCNITAASINATGNVSGNNITADTIAATTLSVINELKANTVTADTVSLAAGATATGKTSDGTVTIKTNTLKVDATTAATTLANVNVQANTSSKVNIVDANGSAIKDEKQLEEIAKAAGLAAGSYISLDEGVPGMVAKIATTDPFSEKLPTMEDLGNLTGTSLAEARAQLAQAYRASEPVRALVNATANAGAAVTQAVTSAFTLGAATRTADLRAGAPASAVVDKGAESDVSSLWLSIKGGETKVDGGDYADTRVRVTTYQAGYDFQLSDADFLGVFFGTASGYAQTEGAYSQRVDIKHAMNYGLYGTHAFRHGQYLDYLLQGGTFDNKIQGQEMWGTKNYGGALGYGWKYRTQAKAHELTWNPYVRFQYNHIETDDRVIAGNEITTDDENALAMKLGLNVTTDFGLYGGLAYSRGLSGSLSSYVNTFAMPEQDFDDNVFYLNLGYKGNVNENTLFNVNLEKTFGDYDGWSMEGRVDFLL